MEAPRLCGQKLMQIFPAGSKDISSCCAFICLLKSQDPAKERKTLMKWQIYLHLHLMKFGKSSPFLQSTLSSAEMLVQSSPPSWDIFRIHPTLPQVQDSWVLFLTWVPMPYGLWSKNLHCLMHLFLHPYLLLSELSTCFFGTGLLSYSEPVLPAPVRNWLGLMSCSSTSMLKEQSKQPGFPHHKPVCNFLWGRTHTPLTRSSQTDGHASGPSWWQEHTLKWNECLLLSLVLSLCNILPPLKSHYLVKFDGLDEFLGRWRSKGRIFLNTI